MLSMIFLSKCFPSPFLATHAFNAFNDFLFSNFSPPPSGQPMLSMIYPSLRGNPCFQWVSFYQNFLPLWQPMLSMIFSQIFFPPPFLATHAFNAFYDFLFIKIFSPPFFATQALNYPPSLALLATHALNHSFRIRPYSFRIRPYSFRIRRRPSSTTLYYSSSTLLQYSFRIRPNSFRHIVSESDRIVSES